MLRRPRRSPVPFRLAAARAGLSTSRAPCVGILAGVRDARCIDDHDATHRQTRCSPHSHLFFDLCRVSPLTLAMRSCMKRGNVVLSLAVAAMAMLTIGVAGQGAAP